MLAGFTFALVAEASKGWKVCLSAEFEHVTGQSQSGLRADTIGAEA